MYSNQGRQNRRMGKLVRDRIPDIIRRHGGDPVVTVLDWRDVEKVAEAKVRLSSGCTSLEAGAGKVTWCDDGTGAAGRTAA